MADLVTIGQLSALIEDQYRLLGHLEDHRDQVPAYDPIFPERNQIELSIAGEAWSLTVTRDCWECCHRGSGRTVLLHPDHPSPFDFQPGALLHFVLSPLSGSHFSRLVSIFLANSRPASSLATAISAFFCASASAAF